MRIAVYTRVSLDREETSESPARQEADCRYEIARRGEEVAEVFTEHNVSAFSGVERPELKRLLAGIESGLFDGLCVWKLDRLTRRFTDLGSLLRMFTDRGAALISCMEAIDTTTPMGQAIIGVLVAQAENEARNTSTRVARAWKSKAERGESHPGGIRLFGYSSNSRREIDPSEATIARDIRSRLLAGDSLYAVAKWLNEKEIRTSAGNEWSGPGIMQWISRPALAGIRTHRRSSSPPMGRPNLSDHDHTPATWDAIFTPDEWREVLDVLHARGRRNSASRGPNHLLTGLLRCGICGGRLKSMGFRMKNGKSFPRYQCVKQPGSKNCGGVAVTKTSLEAFVVDQLLKFLNSAKLRPIGNEVDLDALIQAIRDDERAAHDLTMQRFVNRTLAESDYRPAYDVLQDNLETNRATLLARQSEAQTRSDALRPGERGDLETWWAAATLVEQRAALAHAFREIRVNPAKHRGGNQFDTSRIALEWNWSIYMRAAEAFEATATPEEMAAAEDEYNQLARDSWADELDVAT